MPSRIARFLHLFTVTKPQSATFKEALIGNDDGKLRVIAFSAGGADNVFEFGLVHAFLVSDAPQPHIVAGISSGALVAAMLADVQQAGALVEQNPVARRLAQVGKFRFFLDQIERLPDDFKEAAVPDFTEISARAGLEPLELPTQQPAEKEDRNETALARFGLTRLLNGMLASRIKFGELTRIVRLWLEVQAMDEWRNKALRTVLPTAIAITIEYCIRSVHKGVLCSRIWLRLFSLSIRDAPLLLRLLSAPWWEGVVGNRQLRRVFEIFGAKRLRQAKKILFEPWPLQFARICIFFLSYPTMLFVWLIAPPTILFWFLGNRIVQGLPTGRKNSVLRAVGFLVLAISIWVMHEEKQRITNYISNCFAYFRRLDIYNLHVSINASVTTTHLFGSGLCCALALVGIWCLAGLIAISIAFIFGVGAEPGQLWALFLAGFNIKKDLLTTGVLHKLLMRAFDPGYFGKRNFDQAVNEALGGKASQSVDKSNRTDRKDSNGARILGDWIWNREDEHRIREPKRVPILVAPIAADVSTGHLVVVEPTVATVDALSAACALTPFFEAQKISVTPAKTGGPRERWLVDGACVAREPLQPALDLIKVLNLKRLDIASSDALLPFAHIKLAQEPRIIELCVISPFPTGRLREQERVQLTVDMRPKRENAAPQSPTSESKPRNSWQGSGTLYRLFDIFSLQATHAAKDERSMVTLYNAMLRGYQNPPQAVFCTSPDDAGRASLGNWHVFAPLREIEPLQPIQISAKLARCGDETKRKSLLLATIADGCRASLSALYQIRLSKLVTDAEIQQELEEKKKNPEASVTPPCRKLQDSLGAQRLPGILDKKSPPGIAEICKECQFFKDPEKSWHKIAAGKEQTETHFRQPVADWGEVDNPVPDRINIKELLRPVKQTEKWPRDNDGQGGIAAGKGAERPTVSLVFSGGVFRGVFQVGVLNALNMAGIKPDILAGASVGTIMAAISARIFTEPDPEQRHRQIASVAATFLAIDRLVLTDRFADFIRRFTLRAGAADFSLRDADHLFRRFDKRNWEKLSRRSRRVLGGIHRLTYLDPFELFDLLRLHSPRLQGELTDRLLLFAQHSLNRSGIGSELLGAGPLEQLIKAHVLTTEDRGADFNEFLTAGGIRFLATTTNLTTGELDVLGSFMNSERLPALIPGLLASSAFPGVFQPRMNWELRAASPGEPEELIDGGIADNLPIIPVYRFLFYAGQMDWLTLRPRVGNENRPHLLLTASLERNKRELCGDDLERAVDRWPSLQRRVSELRYNVKVDSHIQSQHDLRRIHLALEKLNKLPEITLPDLHISCVKPEWLCGTFAFHPMLGFRRERQARSIAHGCASTLVHLSRETANHPNWTQHWWKTFDLAADTSANDGDKTKAVALKPRPCNAKGDCCFVHDRKCPFSESELKQVRPHLETETIAAVASIYRYCGQLRTHCRGEEY
jgi:predicted acylesterase/phospholipase RssA